jgi:hypothetical protein
MPGIFISYRRGDSAGHAGRLYDRLRAQLGHDRVFMDVTGIEAGVDFMDAIEGAIGSCTAVLVVIGPDWLTCTDEGGRSRLADPNDVLRLEIGSALARKVRVIPVLVDGAVLPHADGLPDDLKTLVRRQTIELRDTRWDDDADHLLDVLRPLLAPAAPQPVAARAGDLPTRPVHDVAASSPHVRRSPYRAATVVAAVAALAVVVVLVWAVPRWSSSAATEPAATVVDASAVPAATAPVPGPGVEPSVTPPREPTSTATPPVTTAPAPASSVLVPIPNVVGLNVRAAGELLEQAGFAVASRRAVTAPTRASGEVARQQPAAGLVAVKGTGVALEYAGVPRPDRAANGAPDVAANSTASSAATNATRPRLLVLFLDEGDRPVAQELLGALRPLAAAAPRYGRRRPGPDAAKGAVAYSSRSLEPAAAAMSSRTSAWLTKRYGRPITVAPALTAGLDDDLVVVRLPTLPAGP